MSGYQRVFQGLAATMDVGLDLGERDVEERGDLEVALVLEVKEDDRHPLVIRQPAERTLEARLFVRGVEVCLLRRRHRAPARAIRPSTWSRVAGVVAGRAAGGLQLAEEPPSRPIARQVVEAQVRRDCLQPAGRRRARADVVEALERLQEHRLGDVLRLGGTREQPDRGRIHHVLILADERFERGVRSLLGARGARTAPLALAQATSRRQPSSANARCLQ